MANKNEQTATEINVEDEAHAGNEPATLIEADSDRDDAGLSPEQADLAKTLAKQAVAASIAEQSAADEPDDEADGGKQFPDVPPVQGEFLVPMSQLEIWRHHPRRDSRRASDHAAALALSAAEPLALRPIVVIKSEDGNYAVIDGRFRLEAVKSVHFGSEDVEIRCVLFEGTEADAVAQVCDEGLGTLAMTAIEQARALLSLKETSNVSQTEIAKRYPRFTVSKVNNMLRAARAWHRWPELFDILEEPDRASVDYGVKLFALMKKLDASEQAALLDRARDLIDNHQRFSTNEAFRALDIDQAADAADGSVEVGDAGPLTEDIFGTDDQPLGIVEQLAGERLRITLPRIGEITAMSAAEREENAAQFIARIRQHFGLDADS